jgi:hypothetical protein
MADPHPRRVLGDLVLVMLIDPPPRCGVGRKAVLDYHAGAGDDAPTLRPTAASAGCSAGSDGCQAARRSTPMKQGPSMWIMSTGEALIFIAAVTVMVALGW